MSSSHGRARGHTVSDAEKAFLVPATMGGMSMRNSQRRARVPRSRSASNVFEAAGRARRIRSDVDNTEQDQPDSGDLRALAAFVRTTGPATDGDYSLNDACSRLPGPEVPKGSIQPHRRNKQSRLARSQQLSTGSGSAILEKTVEGRPHLANSTPVPRNHTSSDAWFRSRYPVFASDASPAPTNARLQWPNSLSLRRARSDLAVTQMSLPWHASSELAVAGAAEVTPQKSARRATSAALSGTWTALPPKEQESAVREKQEALQMATQPRNGRGRQGPPALVRATQYTSSHRITLELANRPSTAASPSVDSSTGPTAPSTGSARPSRNGPPQLPWRTQPGRSPTKSHSRASKRPANIIAKSTLAVSTESRLPESPGFDIMLLAMNFPAPPRKSLPPTPSSMGSPAPSPKAFGSARPVLHGHLSGECAPSPTPTAAQDEVVHSDRHRPPQEHIGQAEVQENGFAVENLMAQYSVSLPASNSRRPQPESQASAAACLIIDGRHDSATGSSGHGHRRPSQMRQLTATTLSHRQFADRSGSRLTETFPAGLGVGSTPTDEMCGDMPVLDLPRARGERLAPEEDCARLEAVDGGQPMAWRNTRRSETPRSGSASIITIGSSDLDDQRMARRAMVKECKKRDLQASMARSLNSPVPDWLARKDAQARKNSPHRRSLLTHGAHRSDVFVASGMDDGSYLTRGPAKVGVDDKAAKARPGGNPRAMSMHCSWALSSVMVTEIAPGYHDSPRASTAKLAMSSMMVVAVTEPIASSLPLQSSSAAVPLPPPRSVLRQIPLKMAPNRHRPPSITISRNPATGEIERLTQPSTDPKVKRRSLINMQVPLQFPEDITLGRRQSFPPKTDHPAPWQTPRDRTLASRRQDWQAAYPKETYEDRWRSAAVRERVLREKLQREEEISEIVARTVVALAPEDVPQDEARGDQADGQAVDSIERRLERLERDNGDWLRTMKPLLEEMGKTLEKVRSHGRCGSLKMSDFVVDMEIEAQEDPRKDKAWRAGDEPGHPKGLSSLENKDETGCFQPGDEKRMMLSDRRVPEPTRLQPQPSQPDPEPEKQETAEAVGLAATWADSQRQQRPPAGESRSAQDHEYEVQAAIQRQMQRQEAMMDSLMDVWGLPSRRLRRSHDTGMGQSAANFSPQWDGERNRPVDEDSREASGVNPLLKKMRRQSPRLRVPGGHADIDVLDPLMRELRTFSRLSAEESDGQP
ncbi:hypothetical protein GGR56DRAFT_657347 [Xylariaceae sp. FL0804]|nr:hypothetical protein GGR56DRAFT_657347 [Xylariaceae sp. FL0804]